MTIDVLEMINVLIKNMLINNLSINDKLIDEKTLFNDINEVANFDNEIFIKIKNNKKFDRIITNWQLNLIDKLLNDCFDLKLKKMMFESIILNWILWSCQRIKLNVINNIYYNNDKV